MKENSCERREFLIKGIISIGSYVRKDEEFLNQIHEMQDAFNALYEVNRKCLEEVKMLRRFVIQNIKFKDYREEIWFTEMLMNRECGIHDIKDYVKIMLKGYRKTKKEKA